MADKRLISVILILTVFISCNSKTNIDYYEVYKMDGRDKNFDNPNRIFFCKNGINQVCIIEPNEILHSYDSLKIKKDYKLYFNEILNEKIKIDFPKEHTCFEINTEIENDDSKLNFSDFKKKYLFKSSSDGYMIINNKLKREKILSIGYILFKKGIRVTFNENIGVYYVYLNSK